jgi:hypothetical protein
VVRHCLTKEALKDLLILLNLLLPHSVPATQYKFFKAFENVTFQVKIVFVNMISKLLDCFCFNAIGLIRLNWSCQQVANVCAKKVW